MKILIHSNGPHVPTGYGQQTAQLAPRLRALGHDVAISAYWGLGGASMEWEGMTVFPGDNTWGNRTLPLIAEQWGADLVLTLMDVWVLDPARLDGPAIASWCPVDHTPLPPRVARYFKLTGARPVAMSRFGERLLREAGYDPLYAPHGIDTNTFKPDPDARAQVRRALDVEDAFVVGIFGANKGTQPSRKAYPEMFEAFAAFRQKRQDAVLYVHADASAPDGINLVGLAAFMGIPPESIRFVPQAEYQFGIAPADVAAAYGACDVLLNTSYGEGFGLPIVEAQACGTPVIVTDFSSMRELCGAGWAVGGTRYYDAPQAAWYMRPAVDQIRTALDSLARDTAAVGGELRERAREFAMQYDADRVMVDHWIPVLAELEQQPAGRRAAVLDEPWLSRFVPKSGRTALDVGANAGSWTIPLSKRFDSVIAFEPHPTAAATLRARGQENVRVVQAAVGAEEGRLELTTYADSAHTSAVAPEDLSTLSRGAPDETMQVPMIALDDEMHRDVDFLKIDVEGYEVEVLRGAQKLLAAYRPVVLVECHSSENGVLCRGILEDVSYDVEHVEHPHAGVDPGHHWLVATP